MNGTQRMLKRGNELHGGVDMSNPDLVSSPCMSLMLRGHPTSGSVLHLGLGAGEIPRFLSRYKDLKQTAIEYDSRVLDLASHFNLPSTLEILEADANQWVKHAMWPFDYVFHDTGVNHGSGYFKQLRRITKIRLVVNLYGGDQSQIIHRLNRLFKVTQYTTGMNTVLFCEAEQPAVAPPPCEGPTKEGLKKMFECISEN